MITESYISALYYFAYSVVNLAEQFNIKHAMGDWFNFEIGADVFHDDICRALAVDTQSKQVYAF